MTARSAIGDGKDSGVWMYKRDFYVAMKSNGIYDERNLLGAFFRMSKCLMTVYEMGYEITESASVQAHG